MPKYEEAMGEEDYQEDMGAEKEEPKEEMDYEQKDLTLWAKDVPELEGMAEGDSVSVSVEGTIKSTGESVVISVDSASVEGGTEEEPEEEDEVQKLVDDSEDKGDKPFA